MNTIPNDYVYTQLLSISNKFENKCCERLPGDINLIRNSIEVQVAVLRVDKCLYSKTIYFNRNHSVNEFCLKVGYYICENSLMPLQIFLSHSKCNPRSCVQYDIDQVFIMCGWIIKYNCTKKRMINLCNILKEYYFTYIVPISLIYGFDNTKGFQ